MVCLFMAWNTQAQDYLKVIQLGDIVVTGSKIETPVEKSGKTIFKLDREQIEANRGKDISDLLNEIPGVHIVGNLGAPGNNISYKLRGASSNSQTLILIDGVPFNDPASIAQEFDLRLLDLDQIESIEVLKGGLSSLYGTGAAAGVINITLKKAAKERLAGSANVEYGSFNTFSSNASISGTENKFNYLISGGYKSSDGFSAALDTLGSQNFDDDGIESINFLGKFGFEVTDQFSLGLLASLDDIDYDFDGGAFTDGNSTAENQMLKFAFLPTYKWDNGKAKANITYQKNERVSRSDGRDPSNFNGTNFQADVILDQKLTSDLKLIGGVNYQSPTFEQEDVEDFNFNILDPYASLVFDKANLNVQLGGRLNNHSEYGSNFVWNINPSYLIDLRSSKLKVLGSYSTAFIAPTLSQLFHESWGNNQLDAQESESIEGGFEVLTIGQFQFGAVYFYRKDENLIDYVSTFDAEGNWTGGGYDNLEDFTEVGGAELSAAYSFSPRIKMSGHYTYTRSLTDEVILRRVPENKFGFSLSTIPVEKLLVKLTHLHVGETPERSSVLLESYDLFDAFVSYNYNGLTISAGVNNIFDAEYTAWYGYTSISRNYNIGLRFNF